jgi:hypothetical protein
METADEFFHRPTDEPYWSESHYFDAVDREAGVAVHGRLGFYPNRDAANAFFYLVDGDRVYWLREEAVSPADTHGLAFDGEAWTVEMLPVEPPGEWRVTVDGTVARTPADDPGAVLAGEGEAADLTVELGIESRHDPFYYSDGETFPQEGTADRYEVATAVEGEATVEGRGLDFAGPGERDHSWGRRKWAGDAEWLWISGGFADGTAYNHLTFWPAGESGMRMVNGFWFDGDRVHPLTDATVEERPAFGPETTRAWMRGETTPELTLDLAWAEGSATVEVEPFVTTPLDWTDADRGQRAVLNRAAADQRRDGAIEGAGFLENIGQLPHDPDD